MWLPLYLFCLDTRRVEDNSLWLCGMALKKYSHSGEERLDNVARGMRDEYYLL